MNSRMPKDNNVAVVILGGPLLQQAMKPLFIPAGGLELTRRPTGPRLERIIASALTSASLRGNTSFHMHSEASSGLL